MAIKDRKQTHSFTLSKEAAKALRELSKFWDMSKSATVANVILGAHERHCGNGKEKP